MLSNMHIRPPVSPYLSLLNLKTLQKKEEKNPEEVSLQFTDNFYPTET